MDDEQLNKIIKEIPPELVPKLKDILSKLVRKHNLRSGKPNGIKFKWEGGLKKISKDTTSVELQHKSLNWR